MGQKESGKIPTAFWQRKREMRLKKGFTRDMILNEKNGGLTSGSMLCLTIGQTALIHCETIGLTKSDWQAKRNMIIRKYLPEDCKQLSELFYQTVHSVNAKDYTDELYEEKKALL